MSAQEYRVVVPGAEGEFVLQTFRHDEFEDYLPDADTFALLGDVAYSLTGVEGLAWATLLEWRLETPSDVSAGRVESREVGTWAECQAPDSDA